MAAERTFWQRALAWWPVVVALASGASASYVWVSSRAEERVQEAVRAHDREVYDAAHPAIQTRLKALEDYWTAHLDEHNRIYKRLSKAEAELVEMYRFQVGDKAADLEPDPNRRAQAAAAARERFRQYVKDGEGLKDAYRHALESSIPRW